MDEHTLLNLPEAPAWSLFAGSAGRTLILVAAALYLLSVLGWLFGGKSDKLKRLGAWSFTGGTLCLFGAFASLAVLFLNNRFEYPYVFGHSDTRNAPAYRFAGVWSGQEGSFLLWAVASAIFGILAVRGT